MTPEERANYSYYQKKLYNDRDELQAAEARGKSEENIRVKIEIAKSLLSQNIDINTISTATGLSVEKINELKS